LEHLFIAAQSIGELALQLTMRTFHTGGATLTDKDETSIVAKKKYFLQDIQADIVSIFSKKSDFYKYMVRNKGYIVLKTDIETEKMFVDKGDILHFDKESYIEIGDIIFTKNTKSEIFFAEETGKLKIINGKIIKTNNENVLISNSPKISIGKQEVLLPKNSILLYKENETVKKGSIVAKRVHATSVSQDIVDSLKQIEHIIEMRKTKETSLQSGYEGTFDYDLTNENTAHLYVITKDKERKSIDNKNYNIENLIVKKGDYIKEGQKLTFGSIDYNNILSVLN